MNPRLSVNINKVALIRNSRGSELPNLFEFAKKCELYGAQGITVHPRPDQRHVKYSDLKSLKKLVTTEFNIEGYPSEEFIRLVCEIRPDQVTLVPDPPEVLTSNAGWDCKQNAEFLTPIIHHFQNQGIRVSLFLNPEPEMVYYAKQSGTDRIELYTGPYAEEFTLSAEKAISKYKATAMECVRNGLGVNAGHDLNLDNLNYFRQQIPNLLEVSIGHALISDCLYFGLGNVIPMYLDCLK
ncbi:MAG TPA: pyridoxine 5'-phosphate synthase [Saprospiraceae bacterium]|nr:pyridoxine 5'-phosphate synthase [Saprospiraceae bacterium]